MATREVWGGCRMLALALVAQVSAITAQTSQESALLKLLGVFPIPPEPHLDTLESVKLVGGWRYKVAYTVEPAQSTFDEPEDRVSAYLFVPDHRKGEKLPAVVAIHQDADNMHLGKAEPAGVDSPDGKHSYYGDQKYGLDLFLRAYVVLCPDRFGHAERRRMTAETAKSIDPARDGELFNHRVGQLLLKGRTASGKEVYDLMRATDLLCSLSCVDTSRLGAIGHSAGGYNLVYFMFVDKRIKAGVSSCGFFELLKFFSDKVPVKRWATSALPGLATVGGSVDYLAGVAPRPLLLTRGRSEWAGHPEGERRSAEHVKHTEELERYARERYRAQGAEERLKVVYFDGGHSFPPSVKLTAYHWLDEQLNRSQWQREETSLRRCRSLVEAAEKNGQSASLRRFFPLEKKEHFNYLILRGQTAEAEKVIEETEQQLTTYANVDARPLSVVFTLYAPDANGVAVAGNFNGWNSENHKLIPEWFGNWKISGFLPAGVYCYKFVVDGQWLLDPENPKRYYNEEGEEKSVLVVTPKR